jgi:uncharacterized membrane protein (DUF4010 family)
METALPLLAAQDPAGGGTDLVALAGRGAVALLVGLLVGAEREFSHTEKRTLVAGIRTFPLVALLGFTAALLADLSGSPAVLAAVAVAFTVFVTATYVVSSLRADAGATTEIAALTVFLLGALCHMGDETHLRFVAAAAVAAAVLLSLREPLHDAVRRFEREDIHATLKLAAVTLIVLPLLPDRDLGPYDAFNPRRIWKFVVLVAALSFAGYVAVKALGARRGVALTGLFGGLVSSTAVALAFSRRSRETPALARPFAAAVVLASTIMFPRVLLVASAGCPELLPRLWLPLGLPALAGVVASALLFLGGGRPKGETGEVPLRNPFELSSALKFGVLIALVGLASRAAYEAFQEGGLYAVSAASGLADVDGLTVAVAGEARRAVVAAPPAGEVPFLSTAARALLLATLANTAVKGGMAAALGDPALRRRAIPAFAGMLGAGVAGFLLA